MLALPHPYWSLPWTTSPPTPNTSHTPLPGLRPHRSDSPMRTSAPPLAPMHHSAPPQMEEMISHPGSSSRPDRNATHRSSRYDRSFRAPRRSRSASPTRSYRARTQSSSENTTTEPKSPNHPRHNSRGKGSRSACPQCLGRDPHAVNRCRAKELWDGSPARCRRNSEGSLVNPKGLFVCTDWQRPLGCRRTHSATLHECSGCGEPGHGAQTCPKAQKLQGAHPVHT